MRLHNAAALLAAMTFGVRLVQEEGMDIFEDDRRTIRNTAPPPKPKRKPVLITKPAPFVHPAMPEGGWPETRQQRRARERTER